MRSEEKKRAICSSDGSQIQLPGELLVLIRFLQHGGEEQRSPHGRGPLNVCEGQEERQRCAELRRRDPRVTLPPHGRGAGQAASGWPSLTTRLTPSMTPARRRAACACAARGAPPTAPVGLECGCTSAGRLRQNAAGGAGRREGW